jgi:hypothetical protein
LNEEVDELRHGVFKVDWTFGSILKFNNEFEKPLELIILGFVCSIFLTTWHCPLKKFWLIN